MFGHSHYLKGNKSCEQPSQLIFVDVETRAVRDPAIKRRHNHHLRCGVATAIRWDGAVVSRRTSLQFLDAMELWAFVIELLQKKKVTWLYCHNAHFDMTILDLWNLLDNRTFSLHRISKDGICRCNTTQKGPKCWRGLCSLDRKPWFIQLDSDSGRLNIVDSLNYYDVPLRELGRSLDLPKLDKPRSNSKITTWLQYCQRDTDILEKAMLRLMREWKANNCGNWKMTAASLAHTNYCHAHKPKGIVINPNVDVRNLESKCYHGGQISCWFRGEVVDPTDGLAVAQHEQLGLRLPVLWEPVYELDIRGLYPSVMRANQYPLSVVSQRKFVGMDDANKILSEHWCCASVRVRAINQSFPVKSGDTYTYPEGSYHAYLCGPELVRARDTDAIVSVSHLSWYETSTIFDTFVEYWWTKRLEALRSGNDPGDYLAKLMLNSLYGKFAQKQPNWIQRPDLTPPWPWKQWIGPKLNSRGVSKHRAIGMTDYELSKGGWTDHSFPAVSAFVTSYGREFMRRMRGLCPPYSILYQHTDSLIVTKAGMDAISTAGFIRDDELGYFKVPQRITWAVFRGPNNISINGGDKVAGIGKAAKRVSDSRWLVNRVEGITNLMGRLCGPDGTINWDVIDITKPPRHVGMRDVGGGWWEYEPII